MYLLDHGFLCENHAVCGGEIRCKWDEDLQVLAASEGWTSESSVPGVRPGTWEGGTFVFMRYWCPQCSQGRPGARGVKKRSR